MQRRSKKINKNTSGFTLIEILIVTVIAGMVFTTIYAFYASVVRYNVESRYEVIASNLAQEGMEIIRNRRDQNVLREDSLNDGLENGNCYPIINASGPSCSGTGPAIYKSNTGVYTNSDNGNTPFSRECIISGDASEIDVECTVTWDSMGKSGRREIKAESLLTNWYTP
jgi:prepilin-type N-terminal cleavage/methylation domain-containing protein